MTQPPRSVPLVIGVTGHRDIRQEELPLLRDRIAGFFMDIRSALPGLPLEVLSPIAEGADQLVAEVALQMGIPITALLPMPEHLYREDFEGEALARYEKLLQAGDVIELPLVNPGGTLDRDDQYVQLGGYLAAHSHVLLALWDGVEIHSPGGTSHVILFHQHETMAGGGESHTSKDTGPGGQVNPIDFAEDESDLVYHIVCSRQDSGPVEGLQPGEAFWLTRDDASPRTDELPVRYLGVFQRMAEFNEDARNVSIEDAYPLVPGERLEQVPQGVTDVAGLFYLADEMAGNHQWSSFTVLRWGYFFILLAGASFIIYADIYSDDAMIYLYLGSVTVVLATVVLEGRKGWQRKYLDYRVLAEALRVQFYWSLAGVRMDQAHRFSHDAFHERRELQLAWIRNVMRYAGRRADAELHLADSNSLTTTIECWIDDQREYYQRKSEERTSRSRMTRALEIASFVLVILIALVLVFWPGELVYSNLLIALVGLLPFIVAVRQNYAHRTAERELIGQYGYFYRIFSNAHRLILKTQRDDTRREILRALGNAALEESSQWVLRQRERPTGPVMGG